MPEFGIGEAYGRKSEQKKKKEFSVKTAYPKPEQSSADLEYFGGPGPVGRMVQGAINRTGNNFTSGLDRMGQGFGDIVDNGPAGLLTGVPRMVLGAAGAVASPITAAVSPILGPALEPVGEFVNSNIGQPVQNATGYPADITNDLALQALTMGGAKLFRGALPKTTPEQAVIAKDLMKEGVPVYPGQLSSSKLLRNTHDMADQLSFYDNGKLRQQADEVARLQSRLMGENETDLRIASAKASERLGGIPNELDPLGPKLKKGTYDQIYERIGDHPVDAVAMGELSTIKNKIGNLSERSRAEVTNAIKNIQSTIKNGHLSIQGYKDLTDMGGSLSILEGNSNPSIARYGTQLRGILERNIYRQAGSADAQALRLADKQWQHMKTLENAVARGANELGQVPIARLQSDLATASNKASARNASGMPELENLAKAGQSFLKPVRNSGTAERSTIAQWLAGGSVGGGTFALASGAPGAAVPAVAALLLPITIRRVLQSKGITKAMIEEALYRGANPNALRRMIVRTLKDAKHTVPAALSAKQDENRAGSQ